MLQLEITIEMLWPFGPPLGELRDEWDRTPIESIAKIHGTKKQSKKWVVRHFSITRLTKQVELFRLTRHFGQISVNGRQQRKKGGGKRSKKALDIFLYGNILGYGQSGDNFGRV